MSFEAKQTLGTVLFIVGLVLFAVGGVAAYSVSSELNTHHYTMTKISESEAEESADIYRDELKFENLSKTSQSIIERTVQEGGTYTTSQKSSEFIYRTDANQQNVVEYQNEHYRLIAETERSGALAGIGLIIYIPLTVLGGVLLVGGFFLSPLPQRLRQKGDEKGGTIPPSDILELFDGENVVTSKEIKAHIDLTETQYTDSTEWWENEGRENLSSNEHVEKLDESGYHWVLKSKLE